MSRPTAPGGPPGIKLAPSAGQHHGRAGQSSATSVARLGPLTVRDRAAINALLRSTGHFRDEEILVALEVIDAHLARPGQDYHAVGAFTPGGDLLGYACWGPTPCTADTWDLYWIAVTRASQGSGLGTRLLQEVERRLVLSGARLVVIETSTQPAYEGTRRFYRRRGYTEVARVPDFYGDGDDKAVFAKRIPFSRGRAEP